MFSKLSNIDYSQVRKYAKRTSVGIALAALASSGAIYADKYITGKAMRKEIAKEASVMVECPIKGQETKGCLDNDKRANLLDSAKKLEGTGDFRGAGLIYIRLGDDVKAMEMADLCQKTGKEGSEEIRDRITIRAEAIKQYVDAPPAAKAGPDTNASGAPSASAHSVESPK